MSSALRRGEAALRGLARHPVFACGASRSNRSGCERVDGVGPTSPVSRNSHPVLATVFFWPVHGRHPVVSNGILGNEPVHMDVEQTHIVSVLSALSDLLR